MVLALVNLGRLYGSHGLLDQAIVLWREALKQNPCLAETGTNLQIALRAKNDTAGQDAVRRSQQSCSFEWPVKLPMSERSIRALVDLPANGRCHLSDLLDLG
jgi:hypothetical protein